MSLRRFFRLLVSGATPQGESTRPDSLSKTTRDAMHRGQGSRGIEPDASKHDNYRKSFRKKRSG